MRFFSYFLLTSIFLVGSAKAQELIGIRAEPPEVLAGKSVQIVVEFRSLGVVNGACGLLVKFGDGSSELLRVEENHLPVRITRTYKTVGMLAISAEGKSIIRGLNSVFGCLGWNQSAVLNVRAEDASEKKSAVERPLIENKVPPIKPLRPSADKKPSQPAKNIPGTRAPPEIVNPVPNATGKPSPSTASPAPKPKSSLDL